MILLITFFLIILLFFLSYSFDKNNSEKIKSTRSNKRILLKKMLYSFESSEELSNHSNNKVLSNKQLLISNYWRRKRDDDNEFARIPNDNINIKRKSLFESETDKFWDLFNRNKVILLTKSPDWIYAYWNVKKIDTEKTKPILRIYTVQSDNLKMNAFDIEIFFQAKNWYIKTPEQNKYYSCELGLLTKNNIFIPLAESNTIFVPSNQPYHDYGDLWLTINNGKKEYFKYRPNTSLNHNPNKTSSSFFK